MNRFKRVYCRAFQTGLRIALPLLPYRTPKTVDTVERVPEILTGKGCKKALIVTDPGVIRFGLTKSLEAALEKAGVRYAIYDKVVPNPTTATVEEARQTYVQQGCDALIAVGGGSSMDCAKAVGILIARPRTTLAKCKGILKVHTRLPLLIAIPTTAGTGSETTLAAVITDAGTRHKYAINDFPLIPRYAVLDPQLTVSLPPALTAATGLDALTHAVEAYIGRSTTRGTRRDAVEAVKLIFGNLDAAYQNGNDLTARQNMLRAAFLAGCAFTRSYVGYVHAIAHSLGGEYDVPHGYANGVILPLFLEEYGRTIHKKLARLAVAVGIAREETPADVAAEAFIDAVKAMKQRFGIGNTIAQLRREDIPKLARYADKEANPLYPVPVLLDSGELANFYELLLEETL